MTEHIETPQEEHVVYEFFLWSILLKGAISLAEVVAAIAVFLIPPHVIVDLANWFLQFVPVPSLQAALMEEVAKYTTGAVMFVALYLFSRGLVKVILIIGLLRDKLWAYPASLVVMGLFMLYQFYQIAAYHSFIVVGITLFDMLVMYFIWREWQIAKRHAANHTPLPR
jgi:uncharacterized membrane protein